MVANNDNGEQPGVEPGVELEDSIFEDLSANQERVILALLREPTIARAAKASGVGERTVHRWLHEPDFSKAYRQARRDAFGHGRDHRQQ